MSADIPTTEPTELTAGDTWQWSKSLDDYPASTWTLTYYLRGPVAKNFEATADGDDFAVSVAATDTTDYPPGSYQWQAVVSSGTEKHTIKRGTFDIRPNLADTSQDSRSFAQRVVDALEAVIENKASRDAAAQSIGGQLGRSISFMTWDEILNVYDRYRRRVAAETGAKSDRVFIRFGRP